MNLITRRQGVNQKKRTGNFLACRVSVVGTGHLFLVIWLALAVNVQGESNATPHKSRDAVEHDFPITASDVRPHVEYLASPELRGRSGKDALLSAAYVKRRFESCKLKPLFQDGSYFQEIPGPNDENGETPIIGTNVGAFIRGSDPALADEWIIVSAHHDHVGMRKGKLHPGADDNASGVAMILEVAQQLASRPIPLRRSVAFLAFDLEERMLWGSRWFASHSPMPLDNVKLFITADMIGRSLGDLPLAAVFVMGSEHAPQLGQMLDAIESPDGLEVIKLGVDLVGTRSDYASFRDHKIPFLFFSTGEHPDYHTPRDLPEKVDYAKVADVSNLVLDLCSRAAQSDEAPVWTDHVNGSLEEARALNRISTLLLETDGQPKLSSLQRFIISQVVTKTNQIIEKGEVSDADRKWIVHISKVTLLSVF